MAEREKERIEEEVEEGITPIETSYRSITNPHGHKYPRPQEVQTASHEWDLRNVTGEPHLWDAISVARPFILHTASHWANGLEIEGTSTSRICSLYREYISL